MPQRSLVNRTDSESGIVCRVRLSFALLRVLAVSTLSVLMSISPHLVEAKVRRCTMVVPVEHSHLITFESELRVIASRSCRPDGCEDGFDFWGHYTRGGRQFIHLVTTSGPGSIRSPTRYVGDLAFFTGIYERLSEGYGCACLGMGHDHHLLGLQGPSSVDVQQVMSISRRNGFSRWCEIITTAETSESCSSWSYGPGLTSTPRIQLNAYSYTDPENGNYVRTRLLVLPGISPLRLALAHRREIPVEALGEEGLYFPLSHIIYDECTSVDSGDAVSEEWVEELSRQCGELPESLQQGLSIETEDNKLSVSVQLQDEYVLTIRYSRTADLTIEDIALRHRNSEVVCELVKVLASVGMRRPLKRICEYAAAWVKRQSRVHSIRECNPCRCSHIAHRETNGGQSDRSIC